MRTHQWRWKLLLLITLVGVIVLVAMTATTSEKLMFEEATDVDVRYLRLLRYCRRSTNLLLDNYMEHQDNDQKQSVNSIAKPSYVHGFDLALGVIDANHKYKSHVFSIVGSDWSTLSSRRLCLATHTTLDHMHWVAHTAAVWSRGISVAVFTPDVEFHLAGAFISHLHACHPDVARKVSFHFVYPLERPPKVSQLEIPSEVINDCTRNASDVLKDILLWRPPHVLHDWRDALPYPQNLLRNIARKTCPTEFVVCPDVDMLPTSPILADTLEDFLVNNSDARCPKCAFVLPIYEIHQSVSTWPTNKTQLLELVSRKLAQRFHIKEFTQNQGNSKLSVWEKHKESPTLGVLYEAAYSFWYEPIYVSRGDNPPYDERFVGYGNTRNSQVYEMFAQGWKFLLLNNAFLIHWKFQEVSSHSRYRISQATKNARRLKDFMRDMALRYDGDPLDLLNAFPKKGANMLLKPNKSKSSRISTSSINSVLILLIYLLF